MTLNITASAKTNRDWKTLFEFKDGDTDALIDFTGALIEIAVEDKDQCQRLLATTINGKITITGPGMFQLYIPASEMKMCAPGTYKVGGGYRLNGETIDLFEGTLTVMRGIPTI